IKEVLEGTRTTEEALASARRFITQRELQGPLTAMADLMAQALATSITEARAAMRTLLHPQTEAADGSSVSPRGDAALARALVRQFYDAYEDYDALILPITYGNADEAGEVALVRFSPLDAKRLINEELS